MDASIPISGADNWRTEVQQAVNDWNLLEISGGVGPGSTRIHFVYTTNTTADIVVRSDNGAFDAMGRNDVIAGAEPPNTPAPGFQIRINLNWNNNASVTTGQKRYNMVHELGHTIGLRHTNWQAIESTLPANWLPGTPCTDANSVMNGGTATNSWNGFSNYDRYAGQVLYPIDRPSGTFPFLRYYGQSQGDHFYTIYSGELGCGSQGYVSEGIEGYIFQNQATGTVPVYRYASSYYADHFYTRFQTTYPNYVFENIAGYAYSSQVVGTIPIYRYYNQSLGDHFYTRFNGTYSGYVSEGIAWYAFP